MQQNTHTTLTSSPLPSQHPPTLRYPSTSYLSTPLPSHPIHSAHLPWPYTLSLSTLPSPILYSLLPPPLIPSPSVPYASISSCSTQRVRKSQGQGVLVPECLGADIVWCKLFLEDWNDPQPERSWKRVGPKRLRPNRLWTDLNVCVTKRLGRNGFHVTKRLLAEMDWYRNVLLPSYQSTKNSV